jgi:hypothetical protein
MATPTASAVTKSSDSLSQVISSLAPFVVTTSGGWGYVAHNQKMTTRALVKLIKKRERRLLRARARVKSAVGSNRWSTAVRSWVVEFQSRDRDESLPVFESLFKGRQPELND